MSRRFRFALFYDHSRNTSVDDTDYFTEEFKHMAQTQITQKIYKALTEICQREFNY